MDPLPIDAILPEVVRALRHGGNAVVIQAPPGAGKTTRVPLALLHELDPAGMIVMLEPRRIAARAAAATLARNLGEKPGATVGYQVRFDTVASRDTRIMVVTEGILSRRFIADPTLEGISVVILDELHERSIHTDLALAFLRELMDVRDDLKVVAMSATLDARAVSAFLGDAPVVTSAGRPFPVAITHLDRDERPLEDRTAGAIRNVVVAKDDDGGDVLVFLPGAPEIRRVQERLAAKPLPGSPGDIDVVPLYGALSPAEQDRAIQRGARRRVVLATNVAETSLTLEAVTTVVDTGLVKVARHDPATDRSHLDTVRISLSSAEQRAGRAGRTRPGRCVRLWTTTEHHTLEPNHAPEIARADLAPVLLDVLSFHPGDPREFGFFERPSQRALDKALALLEMLGAVTIEHMTARLTPLGRSIAALPVHPRTAAMLLAGGAGGDVEELCLAAALLEDDRAWPREPARTSTDSDLMTAMEAFDERRTPSHRDAARVRDDLRRLVRKHACGDAPLKEALLRAFPDRLCRRRRPGTPDALMVGGRGVALGRESGVLAWDADLFLALALEGDGASARVRIAEAVSLRDVEQALPNLVERRDEAIFDDDRGALAGVRRTRVAGLVVEEKAGIAVSAEAAAQALADVIASDVSRHLPLDERARHALDRLAFARKHLADDAWPEGDDVLAVLPELCLGKRTIADVAKADWAQAILGRLSWTQRKLLDEEVPPRLEVPTGNMITVDYGSAAAAGGAPVLAVRLQELFGLVDTPKIARGRVPVVMHLLSPGYKPVQVTTDLASFWRNTYAEVKKELRARYPKHAWPDDPLTAAPVAKGRSTRR